MSKGCSGTPSLSRDLFLWNLFPKRQHQQPPQGSHTASGRIPDIVAFPASTRTSFHHRESRRCETGHVLATAKALLAPKYPLARVQAPEKVTHIAGEKECHVPPPHQHPVLFIRVQQPEEGRPPTVRRTHDRRPFLLKLYFS